MDHHHIKSEKKQTLGPLFSLSGLYFRSTSEMKKKKTTRKYYKISFRNSPSPDPRESQLIPTGYTIIPIIQLSLAHSILYFHCVCKCIYIYIHIEINIQLVILVGYLYMRVYIYIHIYIYIFKKYRYKCKYKYKPVKKIQKNTYPIYRPKKNPINSNVLQVAEGRLRLIVQVQRHEARGPGRANAAQQELRRHGLARQELPVLPRVLQTWPRWEKKNDVGG